MIGVLRKELRQYFRTMTGYLFIAVFIAIASAYFITTNLIAQNGDIKFFFSALFPIVMFLIPILTMRLFTEEHKQKTDELLLTSPVTLTGIILGKYAATMVVFLLGLAVTLCFPVILAVFGVSELLVTLGSYIGLIFMVSAFVAIGLFISVMTESQLVAAVVTYALLLGLYIIDSLQAFSQNPFFQQVLRFFSINGHYTDFSYGIFNPANIVYYLSVTGLFLFLSVYALESRRIA